MVVQTLRVKDDNLLKDHTLHRPSWQFIGTRPFIALPKMFVSEDELILEIADRMPKAAALTPCASQSSSSCCFTAALQAASRPSSA